MSPEINKYRSEATSRALVAALGQPELARDSWNALIKACAFDSVPNAVIRAMPQIYMNIKATDGVAELPRLRGVYRASWSSNLVTFAAIRPILAAFNQQEISYRVIKGAAISALAGHWGQRTMGDIDVVVADDDILRALQILRGHGFRPLVVDDGGSGPSGKRAQGHYLSDNGAVLDLHSPSGRPDLFAQLFREPGLTRKLLDTDIHVPSSDLLLAVSVWHAEVASAGTDHMQTLLDIGVLGSTVDHHRTRNILLRSDLLAAAETYLGELESLGLLTPVDRADWSRQTPLERVVRLRGRLKATYSKVRIVSSIPRKLRLRKLSSVQRKALRSRPGPRARLYEVWCRSGQFGRLERIIDRHLGGFGPFGPEGGPIPERDFRITIPAQRGVPGRLRLHFHFSDRDTHGSSRILFIDGRGNGLVPLPGLAAGIYEVTPDRDFIQISARPCDIQGSSRITHAQAEWEALGADSTGVPTVPDRG